MLSKTTNRRAVMAGIAAAPALSVPALASSMQPDPIFALIENHRKAAEKEIEAYFRCDEAPAKRNESPRVCLGEFDEGSWSFENDGRITWTPNGQKKPIYAYNEGGIRRSIPKNLSDDEKKAWVDARCAELEADEARIAEARAGTDIGKLEAIRDRTAEGAQQALWDLIRSPPATPAGLVALLGYVREHHGMQSLMCYQDEWCEVLEHSIECAVCALVGLPKPPMSDVVAEEFADNNGEG